MRLQIRLLLLSFMSATDTELTQNRWKFPRACGAVSRTINSEQEQTVLDAMHSWNPPLNIGWQCQVIKTNNSRSSEIAEGEHVHYPDHEPAAYRPMVENGDVTAQFVNWVRTFWKNPLQNGDVLRILWSTNWIYICYVEENRQPLWSSGQSSWLQVQRSGFDSRRYQIFWEAVGLERGPLNLVSTTE
jgi:hypothetical protein